MDSEMRLRQNDRITVVSMTDSITGLVSIKSSYVGRPARLWIRHDLFPNQIYLLDQDPNPEPTEGWSYGLGFLK